MYITFVTKDSSVWDIDRVKHYHASELNHTKIIKMEFIEEHNGEVVYKVELATGITLLAFSDEIKGATS